MVKRSGTEQLGPIWNTSPWCDWLEMCRDRLKAAVDPRVEFLQFAFTHSVCQALKFVAALAYAHHPLYVLPPLTWIFLPKLLNRTPVMRPLKPLPAKVDLLLLERYRVMLPDMKVRCRLTTSERNSSVTHGLSIEQCLT